MTLMVLMYSETWLSERDPKQQTIQDREAINLRDSQVQPRLSIEQELNQTLSRALWPNLLPNKSQHHC